MSPTGIRLLDDQISAGEVRRRAEVSAPGADPVEVFFAVGEEHSHRLVDRADPFVLAALLTAMAHGTPLVVGGPVSASLIDNLDEWQAMWRRWAPGERAGAGYRHIEIQADEERSGPEPPPPAGALAGFSGGVDSCYTLHRHATGQAGRRTVTVDAGVLAWGLDVPLDAPAAFDRAVTGARPLLDSTGAELVALRTNCRELQVDWFHYFGLALAACLTAVSAPQGTGLIAGGWAYEDLALAAGSTAVGDPFLSSDRFTIRHDGSDATRIEKIAAMADWDEFRRHARFCWEGPLRGDAAPNCGRCPKCVTTILEFRAAGVSPACFAAPPSEDEIGRIIGTWPFRRVTLERFEPILTGLRRAGHGGDAVTRALARRLFRERRRDDLERLGTGLGHVRDRLRRPT